jgi:hypothetical protein
MTLLYRVAVVAAAAIILGVLAAAGLPIQRHDR